MHGWAGLGEGGEAAEAPGLVGRVLRRHLWMGEGPRQCGRGIGGQAGGQR